MMKKITLAVTVLFFSAMLLLTFLAQPIHNAALPRVTASRVETRAFDDSYIDAEGNTVNMESYKTAVPIDLAEQGIYVVYTAEKNGTERQFVRLVSVQTGRITDDGYAEVVSGLMFNDRIVTEHTGELYDGAEIILE